MKKNVKLIIALLLFQFSFSQNEGVEKSIFTVQTGLLGAWVNNEARLTNTLVLRTEIGLDAGLFGGEVRGNTGFFLAPVLNIEPRWYYNILKREGKSKNIAQNSANFVTTLISYHPDLFVLSNTDNLQVRDQLAIIPKWGIRRSIAKSNFNFETGIGLGYRFFLDKPNNPSIDKGEVALDLHLRIGYSF